MQMRPQTSHFASQLLGENQRHKAISTAPFRTSPADVSGGAERWTVQYVKLGLCILAFHARCLLQGIGMSLSPVWLAFWKGNRLEPSTLAFSQEYPDSATLIPRHVVSPLVRRSHFLNSLYPRGRNAAQIGNQLLCSLTSWGPLLSAIYVCTHAYVCMHAHMCVRTCVHSLPALDFECPPDGQTGF